MHIAVNAWNVASLTSSPCSLAILEWVQEVGALEDRARFTLVSPRTIEAEVDLPERTRWQVAAVRPSPWGRMWFEQRLLPATCARIRADVLVDLTGRAPLRSPVPTVVHWLQEPARGPSHPLDRLGQAMARAGSMGATVRFRSAEVPAKLGESEILQARAFVAKAFRPTDPGKDRETRVELVMPTDYVLAHPGGNDELDRLLAVWTWAEASLGDAYALVVIGVDEQELQGLARSLGVSDSVVGLPGLSLARLPAVYRGASVFLGASEPACGQQLRWALATGLPIAAADYLLTDGIVGEAGYLVHSADIRGLGAACLTLLVEVDGTARELRQKALLRARSFHGEGPVRDHLEMISRVLGERSA